MKITTQESIKWTPDPTTEKFRNIPDIYYRSWLQRANFDPAGKDILDFGCGSGLITTGISCYLKPRLVHGLDISEYIDHSENKSVADALGQDYTHAFEKIRYLQAAPCSSLGTEVYDCILSWSVIEHVERSIFFSQIQRLYEALKPSGIMILQSAPLYFSPFGSHVYSLPPWSHLFMSESEFSSQVYKENDSGRASELISCKETLNRMSRADFTNHFEKVGLTVIGTHLTKTDIPAPIDLIEKYNQDILIEEQCLWLLKK
jgi:SAM-dependent methyltransferase